MKNISTPLLIIFLMLAISINSKAQKIDNFKYNLIAENVYITYDLITAKEGQEVEVRLYSTLKDFDMRLYRATGDFGKELKGGKNKQIVWNNKEELTSYNIEEMTFKIEVISKQQPNKVNERVKNKGLFAGFFGSEK